MFQHDVVETPDRMINRLGETKYFSINTYHMQMRRRKAIEFRLADNSCCLGPLEVENWIRLILHFVEVAKGHSIPLMTWINPKEMFEFLGFFRDDLSEELKTVRFWFLLRLNLYCFDTGLPGVWSDAGRAQSWKEIREIGKCLKGKHPKQVFELFGLV
jgi:hypothetical protein